MVLVFPLLAELAARTALENGNLHPVRIVPLHDLLLEPVSLFHARRYADYLMVRAANMKLTTKLPDGYIVNVREAAARTCRILPRCWWGPG